MVKTENFYKLGPKICPPPPRFWEGKTRATRRYVTSKLLMDLTKVIASDPQVWLLALI